MATVVALVDALEFAAKQLAPFWNRPRTAALIMGVAAISVYITFITAGKSETSPFVITCSLATALLLGVIWKLQNRLPKISANRIGIVVAITSDDHEESNHIHDDFVTELRHLIESDRSCSLFQFAVLNGYWARQAVAGEEQAREVLHRSSAQILFSGTSRRRQLEGQPTHFLSLRTIIRHVPVPLRVSQALARDMGESLPQKLRVPVDGDIVSFEATSKWIGMGAKFLVGVVSGLASNYEYAEMLFLDVERQLKTAGHTAAFLQPLARQVPKHIRDLYAGWLRELADQYYLKREKTTLARSEPVADNLLQRAPQMTQVYLHKAICSFVLRRDIKAAREFTMKADTEKDTTHHYGLAFLHAYEGDLKRAHDEYREAFKRPPSNPTVPIQSEEFIHLVLLDEPDKQHLFFCTALINYNAKDDFHQAEQDFQKFLDWPGSSGFVFAREKAYNLLARCKERRPANDRN